MHGIVMGGGIGVRRTPPTASCPKPPPSPCRKPASAFCRMSAASYLLSRAPGETGTGGRDAPAGSPPPTPFTPVSPTSISPCEDSGPSGARAERTGRRRRRSATAGKFRRAQQYPACWPKRRGCRRRLWPDSVEEICARLRAQPEPDAQKALAQIEANSPTSLKLALRALREGRRLNQLAPCLAMEFNIVAHLTRSADFIEGIRAAVIDKDRKPKWAPARLEDVSEAAVEDYFRPWE